MNTYLLLKHTHILLALVSGLGFALRGFLRLVLKRQPTRVLLRVAPHLVDTLLLASGIALWVVLRFSPLAPAWFGLKLVLVVAYVMTGIASFRARREAPAVALYVLALGLFVTVAALALYKPF